jgi:hypothetical protein
MPKPRTNPLDDLADKLAASIKATLDAIPQASVPMGMKPVPMSEQKMRYRQMRDDPAAWADIVAQHGVEGAVDYWKSMEGNSGAAETQDKQETQ